MAKRIVVIAPLSDLEDEEELRKFVEALGPSTEKSEYLEEHNVTNDPDTGRFASMSSAQADYDQALKDLADRQRGEPESAMREAQYVMGGGVLSYALEHTGDLTHRMSQHGVREIEMGRQYVLNKAGKVLRTLERPYGFAREHEENMASNAEFRKVPLPDFRRSVDRALDRYAAAHKALPVYNEPLRLARDAAVALGEKRFSEAAHNLKQLLRIAEDPEEYRRQMMSPSLQKSEYLDSKNVTNSPESGRFVRAGLGVGLEDRLLYEAAKTKTFEEFEADFLGQIKHGLYWHITEDPKFRIDPTKGPRDLSSMATSHAPEAGRLMVTSHLEHWLPQFPSRRFVAEIDLSDVPREDYYQVKRGFGNEFNVRDLAKARVVRVHTVEDALRIDAAYDRTKPQTSEALRALWERSRKVQKSEYLAAHNVTNDRTDGRFTRAESDAELAAKTRAEAVGEWVSPGLSHEENYKSLQGYQAKRDRWTMAIRREMSRGNLTPEEAYKRGYEFSGHEANSKFYAPAGSSTWEPLPDTLYHVTTASDAVLATGLKSREELAMGMGRGLGGGADDTISFTDDPKVAEGILTTMHEARQFAAGERGAQDMLAMSEGWRALGEKGEAQANQFKKQYLTAKGDDLSRGVESQDFGAPRTEEQARKYSTLGEKWKEGEIRPVDPTPDGRASRWERVLSKDEQIDRTFDLYKSFLWYAESAGTHFNPVFFLTDVKALGSVPKDQIRLLAAKPKKGAQGFRMSGMNEIRTYTGEAIESISVLKGRALKGYLEDHGVTNDSQDGRFVSLAGSRVEGFEAEPHNPNVSREFAERARSVVRNQQEAEYDRLYNAAAAEFGYGRADWIPDEDRPGFEVRLRELGLDSFERYQAENEKALKAVLQNAQPFVQIHYETVGELLDKGRFATLHDKDAAAPLSPETESMRRRYETEVFGVRPDADLGMRPVYGYLWDSKRGPTATQADIEAYHLERLREDPQTAGWSEERMRQEASAWASNGTPLGLPGSNLRLYYGDVSVRLKDEVRTRTTFTVGDSLAGYESGAPPIPQSLAKPTLDASPADIRGAQRIGDIRPYVEAQIHGGITLRDIDALVFPRPPSPALTEKMRAVGVRYEVADPKEPAFTNEDDDEKVGQRMHLGVV